MSSDIRKKMSCVLWISIWNESSNYDTTKCVNNISISSTTILITIKAIININTAILI